ncbi:poly-beta-1,6 N-acetyl-D-glucosamine synthase [bacterium]|nr:poly-beta-1,6 N-acetyl-D-glucosamine synthase [bacterium]
MDLLHLLDAIEHSRLYFVALVFFAWYPVFSSIVWIVTSLFYFGRRETPAAEREQAEFYALPDPPPPVTVLIPAFNEAADLPNTLAGCAEIDYPDLEIVVVDDASTDATVAAVRPFLADPRFRLVRKTFNEGKAMALNDAIPVTRGEIIIVIDADARPAPELARVMVPHFKAPRVGAVTGNPRVANRKTFLAMLQTIEFTSIISLQRRAQRIFGRIMTMSGVVGAFHRWALLDVGLYHPEMATEDIDLTWRLQLRHWDIRYEPRAVVWMNVPIGLRGLWRQRRRWALGLAQVIRAHGSAALTWRHRRLWPVLSESLLSMLWAYDFVILTSIWILSYAMGYPPVGASPIPNMWGMIIATICLAQLGTGVLLDRRYDKRLGWYYGVAVLYPMIYWMLMAVVTFLSAPRGLFLSPGKGVTRWKPVRDA